MSDLPQQKIGGPVEADHAGVSSAGVSPAAGALERFAYLPVAAALVAVAVLSLLDFSTTYRSPQLLLLLNLVFSTLISAIVCFRIGRAFLADGSSCLLMFGCGVLIWGAAGLRNALVGFNGIDSARVDVNTLLTIYNCCVWISALFHLAGAAFLLKRSAWRQAPRLLLACSYLGSFAVFVMVALAAARGWLPPFFLPGQGGTLVRQFVLGSAISMFILTSILLRLLNRRRTFVFAHWYGLALLLLAVGLLGLMLQKFIGTPLGWAARCSQYLAGIYMLVATLRSGQEPFSPVITMKQVLDATRHRIGVAIYIAVASVSFAAAVRLLFLQSLGLRVPYITFFPAVMLAAVYGGLGSGLIASVFSALLILFYWTEPVGSFVLSNPAGALLDLALFLGNGALISWITSQLHRANTRAVRAEAEAGYALERQRAAESLRASEERYRTLVMTAPISVMELDRDGKIGFANRCSEGFDLASVIDSSCYDHFAPESGQMLRDGLEAVFASRKPKRLLLKGLGKNREMRWYESVLGPVIIDAVVSSVVQVSIDVTERQEMQDRLERLSREQEVILETAPVGITLVVDGKQAWVNRKAEELFFLPKEGALGQNPRKLYLPLEAYGLLGTDAYPHLANGQTFETEQKLLRRDGSLIWLKFIGKAIDPRDMSQGSIWILEEVTERKQAETALRESEERFRELFTKSTTGIALVDPISRRVFQVNPRFAEIVGRTSEEMPGIDWISITHPDDVKESIDYVAQANSGQANGSMNKRYFRPDGSIVWVKMTIVPLTARAGLGTLHLCTIEDVTQSKLNEESLLKLSEAVEQSPVAIIITDIKGDIEFVNPMFTELTGYAKEEVLGRNPHFMEAGSAKTEGAGGKWETISSGNIWEGEFHNRKKSGEMFWEQVKISPVRNGKGVVTGFISIKQNITRHKVAEELLRRSEERFRQLFDQSNDAIVILQTENYAVLDCNVETERTFGYRREELLGKDIFFMADSPELSFADLGGFDRNSWQIDRIAMRKKDGTRLIVSAAFKLIKVNADEVFYCSCRDITDRIRIEDEARTAQANLIQSDKMASLGLLVSGMAHEINNPNNCILFNSELLAKTWNSVTPILEAFYRENGDFKLGSFRFSEAREVIPKLFSGLVDGAERIRSIVDMLKDFSRQDRGDMLAPLDLNKVITDAIAMVNYEIKKRCNRFYLEIDPDVPPATGNAQQIEQVLINLIMNSLQSLRDRNCAVRVSAELTADRERIAIIVADEGEGMSAEVMQHLTDPFFTTRGDSGGTGLGLSISSSILQKNQGSISFVSSPGKGTTARVELRVFRAPEMTEV